MSKRPGINGSILITSLWMTTILSLLAMGLGFRASIEARLGRYSLDKIRARYIANAGIAKAKEALSKDGNAYDSLYECGTIFVAEESPENVFGAASNILPEGEFSIYYLRKKEYEGTAERCYGMMDEERKININIEKTAPGNVAEYKRMLSRMSPFFTDEVINAMIDWQDPDSVATLPGGAEEVDYALLERPYACKNGSFETVEELALVKGMTPEALEGVRDYITVYTDGRINLNTASKEVLSAVINDDAGTYTNLVEKITSARRGEDGSAFTKDDKRFVDLNDLSNQVPFEEAEAARLAALANRLVFKSKDFRISSHGSVGKITKTVTIVIGRESGKVEYYHEE